MAAVALGRPLFFWNSSALCPSIASTEPKVSINLLLRLSPMPGTPSSRVRATRFARFFLCSSVLSPLRHLERDLSTGDLLEVRAERLDLKGPG